MVTVCPALYCVFHVTSASSAGEWQLLEGDGLILHRTLSSVWLWRWWGLPMDWNLKLSCRGVGIDQFVECMLSMCEVMCSIPCTSILKKKSKINKIKMCCVHVYSSASNPCAVSPCCTSQCPTGADWLITQWQMELISAYPDIFFKIRQCSKIQFSNSHHEGLFS